MSTFGELSSEQKSYISNGCGGNGHWVNPPDFGFGDVCGQHDLDYWIGGSESDRLAADRALLEGMKKQASFAVWYRRPILYAVAYSYYCAVRVFAKAYFTRVDRKKTIDDLIKEMQPDQNPTPSELQTGSL